MSAGVLGLAVIGSPVRSEPLPGVREEMTAERRKSAEDFSFP
jgi:hypothetical protein